MLRTIMIISGFEPTNSMMQTVVSGYISLEEKLADLEKAKMITIAEIQDRDNKTKKPIDTDALLDAINKEKNPRSQV